MNIPFFNNNVDSLMQKRVNLSIGVSILGGLIGIATLLFVLRGCEQPVHKAAIAGDAAIEMRQLNDNVIAAKQELLTEAKKSAEETRMRSVKMDAELESIHTELNVYKKHSNAEIKRIGNFNTADIVSEFSKLEAGQRNAASKPTEDSPTDY